MIIGKAAQRDEGERYADDRDAFAAQEERCSSWRRAKRGGVVACGSPGFLGRWGVASYLERVPLVMDMLVYRVPQFEQLMMTLL